LQEDSCDQQRRSGGCHYSITDCNGAVADENIDNRALEDMALVKADHATKEAEKEATVKQ
jgi:hypothetical protein